MDEVALGDWLQGLELVRLWGTNADDVGLRWSKVQQGEKMKYNQGCIYVDVGDSTPLRSDLSPQKGQSFSRLDSETLAISARAGSKRCWV